MSSKEFCLLYYRCWFIDNQIFF